MLVFEFGVHSEQEFEPLWGSEEVNVLDLREFSTSGSSKKIFRQDIEKRDETSLANVFNIAQLKGFGLKPNRTLKSTSNVLLGHTPP